MTDGAAVSPVNVRRRPLPWWGRLLGWIVVLAIGATSFVLVVRSGSAQSTSYTYLTGRRAGPDGSVAAALQRRTSSTGVPSIPPQVSAGTVAVFSRGGVTGLDAVSGKKVWSYLREDTTVCAGGVNRDTVVVVFRTGARCDQAIGFVSGTGARKWQRTFETADGNRVLFGNSNLLVISRTTLNVIDMGSAYQRFMLTASSPSADDPQNGTTCEFLSASATISVVSVLQQCRASDSSPWQKQVLAENEDSGQPRELSRVTISDADARLVGTLDDGSALLAAGAAGLLVVASGGGKPQQLAGIEASAEAKVYSDSGTDLISVAGKLYALTDDHRSVAWSANADSRPQIILDQVAYLSRGALRLVDSATGKQRSVSTLSPPPDLTSGSAPATLTITGNLVGIATSQRVTTYT